MSDAVHLDRSLLGPEREPVRRVVDLDVGRRVDVTLADGATVPVELLELDERTDSVNGSVRAARVRVRVGGEEAWLTSATYHLPQAVGGVQVDCPITKGYYDKAHMDPWALDADARLRLWPAGSSWLAADSFIYPARQRWFATDTQMSNEPVFVDGGDLPGKEGIYYHNGLDIGGAEGLVDVVASTDGVVVARGEEAVAEIDELEYPPRYDRVAILDARGWVHANSHLKTIDEGVKLGQLIRRGDPVGVLGKEGSSGGWSHLHFQVKCKQPSGRYGTEEGYAFLWEAYLREYDPAVIAVARPHHLLTVGETAVLDGARSWTRDPGGVARFEWTFTDGSCAEGPTVERAYAEPGAYSEVLKVTDAAGAVAYDFAVVQVFEPGGEPNSVPTIHAAAAPTFGVKAGEPVTLAVRVFRAGKGEAEWDFGDGSPPERVPADGDTAKLAPDGYTFTPHVYNQPGDYVARVERTGDAGAKAVGHVHVRVEAD